METDVVTKTLIAKIAEACDAVGGVEKKGRNQAQGYDYVKAADVAKAIRHELFSRGVVILQDEESTEWLEFTTMKGTVMRECRLKIAYKISDGPNSEVIVHAYGVAMDSGDKAIYKAKTGALKYFLRGLGLIPDEKDDPEADESVDRHMSKGRTNGHEPEETNGNLSEQLEFIANASTPEELKKLYTVAYTMFRGNIIAQNRIIAAKDQRKAEL